MLYERREVDVELEKIKNLVAEENRKEERAVLMVLQGLTSIISMQTKYWEEKEKHDNEKFENHEDTLKAHGQDIAYHKVLVIKSKVSWWWLSFIVTSLSTAFAGMAVYSYSLIAGLRDEIRDQKAVSAYLNKANEKIIDNQHKNIDEQIQEIEQIVSRIKHHVQN